MSSGGMTWKEALWHIGNTDRTWSPIFKQWFNNEDIEGIQEALKAIFLGYA